MDNKHIEYFCFTPHALADALKKDNMPDTAKDIVLQFMYGASAEQHKLFHTNEHLGAAE